MTKAWDKFNATYDKLVAEGNEEAAELCKARYTVSRYKAVCFGDLPDGWGMGLAEAHGIVDAYTTHKAAAKAQAEAAKIARREAREAKKEEKLAGKKRARE